MEDHQHNWLPLEGVCGKYRCGGCPALGGRDYKTGAIFPYADGGRRVRARLLGAERTEKDRLDTGNVVARKRFYGERSSEMWAELQGNRNDTR